MSNVITTANEQLDYPFLLVTHMVCADQQIHSEESKALHELANQIRVGQHTLDEMEKILTQDEHQMSVEDVTRRVPPEQQSEAMRQILALAYIDGFFSLTEIAPQNIGRKIEQLRREILLAELEYDNAIRQCAVILWCCCSSRHLNERLPSA